MNIGILTYHWVPNFGAQMQTFSTVLAVKQAGHTPVVINWMPSETGKKYQEAISPQQVACHTSFVDKYFNVTRLCTTTRDIVETIRENDIKLMIVGSDSVFNLLLPATSLLRRRVVMPTPDHVFPNPFWGTFAEETAIPIVALAVSSQNSNYRAFSDDKALIQRALERFAMITVRDAWTRDMVSYFTDGQCVPAVIPDPVFGFNDNNPPVIDKKDIQAKYGLPDDYILLSFANSIRGAVSRQWVSAFQALANRQGVACVEFPRPLGAQALAVQYRVPLPLPPLDWYYLIKYSRGYVGQLMHPIVVALHNSVPCFSYDHYGVPQLGGLSHLKSSSKIYALMQKFGLLANYHNISEFYRKPTARQVFDALSNYNVDAVKHSAEGQSRQFHCYLRAMTSLC